MKKTLRLTVIITVVSLLISACAAGPRGQNGSAAVDTVTAKTMRLIRAEGSIELTDESGASLPLEEGMRLFSGTSVETQAKSKAGISLDDVKAATVGVESLAALFQESRLLRLNLIRGELYFSVAKPLEKDEEFYIETSNMTMGIRGTSGYVSTISASDVKVGESVTLTALPKEGTAPYRYTYEYKKPGAASWKTIGKRGAAYKSVNFTTDTTGTYQARIYIQDASNYVTVKTFKVKVS